MRADSHQHHLAIDLTIALSWKDTGTHCSILSEACGQLIWPSRNLEMYPYRKNRISLRPPATRSLLASEAPQVRSFTKDEGGRMKDDLARFG
jgi:hypothetical protein